MNMMEGTTTATKYAVIPAEGFYGDFAGVISTHSSLAAAKRNSKPQGILRFAVIEVATTTRKGDKIHRTDVREVPMNTDF